MAGSNLRSTRRSARNVESAGDSDSIAKSETLSTAESFGEISIPISPLDSSNNIGATESTEDTTSESGSSGSRKSSTSSSESSSVTSNESLNKTKEELIQSARDLDSQLKDLMKM
jgi:hypothetical protein